LSHFNSPTAADGDNFSFVPKEKTAKPYWDAVQLGGIALKGSITAAPLGTLLHKHWLSGMP